MEDNALADEFILPFIIPPTHQTIRLIEIIQEDRKSCLLSNASTRYNILRYSRSFSSASGIFSLPKPSLKCLFPKS